VGSQSLDADGHNTDLNEKRLKVVTAHDGCFEQWVMKKLFDDDESKGVKKK
jgi:hypothetical protein